MSTILSYRIKVIEKGHHMNSYTMRPQDKSTNMMRHSMDSYMIILGNILIGKSSGGSIWQMPTLLVIASRCRQSNYPAAMKSLMGIGVDHQFILYQFIHLPIIQSIINPSLTHRFKYQNIYSRKIMDKWFDVQDEEGVWRVGECLYQDSQAMKKIGLDGFPPNFNTLYCRHSQKILPIRTKTKGLTSPENPLREVITQQEIQSVSTRLELLLMKTNLLEIEGKYIRQLVRTELLILTHKIFTTPYEIIREVKMMDLAINKFFINLLTFYLRLIDFSKAFLALLENNSNARELYESLFELSEIVNLITGIHPDSLKLYSNKLNIMLTPQGFIDCLIKSEGGLLPFRLFLKNSTLHIKKPSVQVDYQISLKIITLFLELCDKAKNDLVVTDQMKTVLILDEAISHLRKVADMNPQIFQQLSNNPSLLNKIEALFYALKKNKTCPLRKFLQKQQKPSYQVEGLVQHRLSLVESVDKNESSVNKDEFKKLQERLKKMEELLLAKNTSNLSQNEQQKQPKINLPKKQNKLPVQNLGEQMFLGSVQWALQCGDIETAKKLVKWRRSLLQVGRITGWEVALTLGMKTFAKGEITAADIIQANYQYLCNSSTKQ